MCGIAGIYYFKSIEIPKKAVLRMTGSLKHRGPDAEGFFFDQHVGLGHRRLKIIDLSEAAAQPMTEEHSRFQLIFNGEVYNFLELRRKLEATQTFFSKSDTEVILRLFKQQREKSWSELNGMFAAALYDRLTNELFLARDHAGIKPLYYYLDTEKLIFASEIKALLASELFQTEPHKESLAHYLRLGYFPSDTTPYENVHKLLPGHYVRIWNGGTEIRRFWNVRSFHTGAERMPVTAGASPVEALDSFLVDAVQQQMISDVPLGAFLSGGIDSSLIVALMTRLSQQPVKTFTVGFGRMGYYDERAYAEKIARKFKTEHHEFVVEKNVRDIVPGMASIFGEPFADSSAIPALCLSELARKHVTVALTGTGGDEMFGGYRKYMAAHWTSLLQSIPSPFRSGIRKAIGGVPASRKSIWGERALLLKRFASLPMTADNNLLMSLNEIFTADEVELLTGSKGDVTYLPVESTLAQNLILFDYEYFLPDDLLVKEDRCSMAFGLETRVPFLDRRIVEFMTSLPLHYKVSGISTKTLFKRVASAYLPRWVLRRPKHGFGSPVAEWLKSDLKEFAHSALFAPDAFFKSSLIQSKWKEHQSNKADNSRQLWAILMLELWNKARASK
jgi:asparagine synthase (glutamine-hydrolysing)